MASEADIFGQLKRLIENMPAPRGVDFDRAYPEYVRALSKYAIEHIREAVDRVFDGEFRDGKTKAYPRVAELAVYVRQVQIEHSEKERDGAIEAQIKRDREEADAAIARREARTPEQKEIVQTAYARFLDAHNAAKAAMSGRNLAQERAEIRQKYGMTPERLATIPDRPLPAKMALAADALPGIPVPMTQEEIDRQEFMDST